MFEFIWMILELITNPKGSILKLALLILFVALVSALRNWNDSVVYIFLWIFYLVVLYWLISFVRNSKNCTEMWIKVIRIIALALLVLLCYKVESQTVLYVYLWILWILLIYTLRIVISWKIKDTKDKLKDTSLKEEMWESIADFTKWQNKWLWL